SDQNLKNLTSSMSEKLQSLLNNDKQKNGATLGQISSMISNKLSAGVATLAANSLVAKEKWSFVNGLYGLSGHRAEMSSAAAKLWEKVEPILQSDPIRPPVVHDLAKTLNLPPRALEKLLSELTKLGYLIKPVSNRYFLPEGISQLELHVHETSRLNADGKFSVKEYRDVTQIGRNLCIEILEYFDIKRITQRIGDQRITIAKQS
ncbi:SelB C-terminal domain-containing protein, partial [Pseudomonadales bacterium]|nr:SelB C-terminal domain-containing protein [Pseudomonadales bacterium]